MSEPPPRPAARLWRSGTLTYSAGGLAVLFAWLLGGDFALSVRDRVIPPVMQVLFRKYDASDLMTGVIFASLPGALALFLGPVIAYKSDRLRSRWGRRAPFMVGAVPFIVLATAGLAFSPQLGRAASAALGHASPGAANCSLALMALSWTVFELGCITTGAVFGAFLNDVVPKEVLGLFRAVSLLAGILFFFNVLGQAQAHFTWIFLGVGAIYGVAFCVMCWMVREGEPPEIVDALGPHPGLFGAVITYFRDGFGRPYYLCFFAATILGAICTGPFNLYSLYYSESLGMSDAAYGACIGWSYFISLFLSVPIGLAADRYHPLRLSMLLLLLYGVIMAGAGFLVRNPAGFGIALIAHTVISGSLFTAWSSLPQRLLPRARFAEIGSAGGILSSITGIFFAPAVGQFLDWMHHDYRYTFFICAALTFATLLAFGILHGRFMALGGPKNYVAPE
jgi:MFS family permease